MNRRVTFEQMKIIVDFMAQHNDFATGALRTVEARHASKKLWAELTNMLNSTRYGPKKTANGWSKYWSDFKNKLKNKVTVMKTSKRSNVKNNVTPLSKLERRVLAILGAQFSAKKNINNYIKRFTNHRTPKVKLEAHNESLVKHSNPSSSDSSEVFSETDTQNNEDSIPGFGDSEDITDVIQNVYPKWLIEVEKKRAEADLTRAKAEEQRVIIAAKEAEVRLIQTEALKKLADATAIQADAILRIATAIERNQTDVLAII